MDQEKSQGPENKPDPAPVDRVVMRSSWFEEYKCGCVSGNQNKKRDLIGYCSTHGEDRRRCWRELEDT